MTETPLQRLRAQSAATMAQRDALRLRAAQTVDRLTPQRLAGDAADLALDLAEETRAQVRAHPFTALGVVAAAGVALFHRPLGRLVDRWLDRLDPPGDDAPLSAEDGVAGESEAVKLAAARPEHPLPHDLE